MQVEMADIGTELSGLRSANEGIHVCAIDIHLATVVVDDCADLANGFFKHAMS
jgi:hypothetical protein